MENLLLKIIEEKKKEIETQKLRTSLSEAIYNTKIKKRTPIIAEIKRKSPKSGKIRDVDVINGSKIFQEYGACALSVLTDKNFDGSLENLMKLREMKLKGIIKIPLLRKDFIIDETQICESYVYGADAILLIAKILREKTKEFLTFSRKLNMECVVEIHDEDDLRFIYDANIIGINTRNLENFEIEMDKLKLAEKIKGREKRIVIAESGIENKDEVRFALKYADALLIGTGITKNFELLKEFVNINIEDSNLK